MELQQRLYNMPTDLQRIMREFGMIKMNNVLLCIGKLDMNNYQKLNSILLKWDKVYFKTKLSVNGKDWFGETEFIKRCIENVSIEKIIQCNSIKYLVKVNESIYQHF